MNADIIYEEVEEILMMIAIREDKSPSAALSVIQEIIKKTGR